MAIYVCIYIYTYIYILKNNKMRNIEKRQVKGEYKRRIKRFRR